LRFFYDHAATGYKDHGCDKAKDSKKVPVHALGYILIVFEVISTSAVLPDDLKGRNPVIIPEKPAWYHSSLSFFMIPRVNSFMKKNSPDATEITTARRYCQSFF
jgi:hypothetical protein